jgi:hypothetical protein
LDRIIANRLPKIGHYLAFLPPLFRFNTTFIDRRVTNWHAYFFVVLLHRVRQLKQQGTTIYKNDNLNNICARQHCACQGTMNPTTVVNEMSMIVNFFKQKYTLYEGYKNKQKSRRYFVFALMNAACRIWRAKQN